MAVRHRADERATGDAPWRPAEWPEIRPEDVVVSYERPPLDTLYVTFGKNPAPGYYVPIEREVRPYDGLFV